MERRRPFVLAKWASTLDGRIADAAGESRWITGEAARRRALRLREEYDAVLVGAGTIAADDPRLTRRLGLARAAAALADRAGRTPARLSETARVLRGPRASAFVVDGAPARIAGGRAGSRRRGVRIWVLRGRGGRVDLRRLLAELGRHGVASLMVEGGGRDAGGLLRRAGSSTASRRFSRRASSAARAPGGRRRCRLRAVADRRGSRGMRVERVGGDLARDRSPVD